MVKICQTGLLKLNFEIIQKKHFPVFAKKFSQAMDEVEIFFCQFPNPRSLGCRMSQNVKKPKLLHSIIHICP